MRVCLFIDSFLEFVGCGVGDGWDGKGWEGGG